MLKGLLRTKSLDHLLSDAESGVTLKRTLTALDLTALGIGAIIGAGIFATVGTAAAGNVDRPGAGPAIILSFVFTAIACGFCALCYAELASLIPISGSAYTYSYATLGEIVAWIIGWDLIIEYAIGNVAVAISWAGYLNQFLSGFGIQIPPWLRSDFQTARECVHLLAGSVPGAADPAQLEMCRGLLASAPSLGGWPLVMNLPGMAIVALLTVLLVVGIKESSRFNNVIVGLKILIILFFIAVGCRYVRPANWSPFMPGGWAGVQAGAAIVFFSYIGFDAVSTAAEETKNPKRDLPLGLLASLAICTVLYIVVAAVLTGMLPAAKLNTDEPLAFALTERGLNWAAGLTSLGALIAMTAVLLVFQMGQPRIFFSMSRDGLLPPYFAKVHPRFRTPHVTTIWTGVVVALLSSATSLGFMVELTNIGTLFAFVLVCGGVVVLRAKDPDRPRPFRIWWVPLAPLWLVVLYAMATLREVAPWLRACVAIVAILGLGFNVAGAIRKIRGVAVAEWMKTDLALAGIACCLYLMDGLPAITWKRFGVWLLTGFVIYFFYGWSHSKLNRPAGANPS
jgi:APA family basic amino acid/polyamine antiporter